MLKEHSASQEHFIDLCRLLGERAPAEADLTGATYCCERGTRKDTGGDGWADAWKRSHLAWEYKRKPADPDAAFGQLRLYAVALENPPPIVSDMLRLPIRTNWTNTVSRTYVFGLDDFAHAATRDRLNWAFSDRSGSDRVRFDNRSLNNRRGRSRQSHRRCGSADMIHTPSRNSSTGSSSACSRTTSACCPAIRSQGCWNSPIPAQFPDPAGDLFQVTASGRRVGFERVDLFNGGVFNHDTAKADIAMVPPASNPDWSEIDPATVRTPFERGLDPHERAQLGAPTARNPISRHGGPSRPDAALNAGRLSAAAVAPHDHYALLSITATT